MNYNNSRHFSYFYHPHPPKIFLATLFSPTKNFHLTNPTLLCTMCTYLTLKSNKDMKRRKKQKEVTYRIGYNNILAEVERIAGHIKEPEKPRKWEDMDKRRAIYTEEEIVKILGKPIDEVYHMVDRGEIEILFITQDGLGEIPFFLHPKYIIKVRATYGYAK